MLKTILLLALVGGVASSYIPGLLGFKWNIADHPITEVYNPSPALVAGLEKGDKVVSWEDRPDSWVRLTVLRKGKTLYFDIQRAP